MFFNGIVRSISMLPHMYKYVWIYENRMCQKIIAPYSSIFFFFSSPKETIKNSKECNRLSYLPFRALLLSYLDRLSILLRPLGVVKLKCVGYLVRKKAFSLARFSQLQSCMYISGPLFLLLFKVLLAQSTFLQESRGSSDNLAFTPSQDVQPVIVVKERDDWEIFTEVSLRIAAEILIYHNIFNI